MSSHSSPKYKFQPGDWVTAVNVPVLGAGEVQGPYPWRLDDAELSYVVYFPGHAGGRIFPESVLKIDALHMIAKL